MSEITMTDIGLIWLAVISIISIAVTVSDKRRAKKKGARRVPELDLFVLSALGGGIAMYITMLLIRHKTLHKRFMIGIPAIVIAEAAAGTAIWYYFLK